MLCLFAFSKSPFLDDLIVIDCFDMQGKLYMIMEICRGFDQIYKEHLDGV